ncbi:hypothetical protein [Salibaculum griseiflavum]|jgi:uncharacterized protein YebE (UPF0316 family)|uniref:hypothetical protein n=1 Tax=Salibaculum griseiflavum TaxID=1914409 RepID=UPI0011B24E53|nr:hypothetical protein [Salibaculum griseiflavum]
MSTNLLAKAREGRRSALETLTQRRRARADDNIHMINPKQKRATSWHDAIFVSSRGKRASQALAA